MPRASAERQDRDHSCITGFSFLNGKNECIVLLTKSNRGTRGDSRSDRHDVFREEVTAVAKVLRCRDTGSECDFVARGATEEEIWQQVREHVKEHDLQFTEDLKQQLRPVIRDE